MLEGLRWVWQQRLIRVTTLCAVVLNLFFSAFYIIIIVLARHRGIPAGQIGIMAAMLGAGGLVGALLAPALTEKLSPFVSIASVFWILTLLTPAAIFIHNGYLLGALLFAMALLPPTANTTIMARQLVMTPDDLRGRLSGALGLMAGGAGAVGPMLGGVLIGLVSGNEAVLICAAGMAAITVLVTVSPTLRHFPRQSTGEDTGETETGETETGGTETGGTGDGEALADVPERQSIPN
jgi:MFS family permease